VGEEQAVGCQECCCKLEVEVQRVNMFWRDNQLDNHFLAKINELRQGRRRMPLGETVKIEDLSEQDEEQPKGKVRVHQKNEVKQEQD
jgi:hypothetical protein